MANNRKIPPIRPPRTAPTVTGVDGAEDALLLVAAADEVVDDAFSEVVASGVAVEIDEAEYDMVILLDVAPSTEVTEGPSITGA